MPILPTTRTTLTTLALLLFAGIANAAPQLAIARFGYQITQVQPVPGIRDAFDITARTGVLNGGDAAVDVTARLTSSHPGVVILDGDVAFGDVPHTARFRPAISHDTFALRITFPRQPGWPQLLAFVRSLQGALVWQVSCGNCGAANRAPAANAGPDQTAYVAQVVTLNGSASSDPEGQALSYEWSFVSRPAGSTAALSHTAGVQPVFTPDREGDYLLQLIVSDGLLRSAPDTVQVSTLNTAPIANAGADQAALVGQTLSLDGSASSDVDGDPLTYAWSIVSRPAGSTAVIGNSEGVLATFVPDLPGQYVIELVVDDGTISSAPDTTLITTTGVNGAPVANAGPDQTARVGEVALLDGSASADPDSDPLTFSWSLSSRPPASNAVLQGVATESPMLTIDRPGTYVAQLIVNDGQADSAPDTVAISTLNSPPTAIPGVDRTVTVGARVRLDGSQSSDPDGDALAFSWSLLTMPDESQTTLDDPDTIAPSFVADQPGVYVAQLIVNDGSFDSAPSTLTVTAESAPEPEPDDDSDGVTDVVENGAPNGGDGNADGIPDVEQANVASLPNAVDGRYVSLVAPEDTLLVNVRATSNPSPANAPEGVAFPFGFFAFEIRGLVSPATQLQILLPAGSAPTSYWKYGPEPGDETAHWYEFLQNSTGTGAAIAANVVTLAFIDNARGDDDRSTPGVIIDQGGPTVPAGLYANAGADQEGVAWIPMMLDGSASRDAGGTTPVAFEWSVIDAPPDSQYRRTPHASSQAAFQFVPDAYGTFQMRLTVSGAAGTQASDELLIVAQPRGRIQSTPNSLPDGVFPVGTRLESSLQLDIVSLVPNDPTIGFPALTWTAGSSDITLTLDPAASGVSSFTSPAGGSTRVGAYVQAHSSAGNTSSVEVTSPGYVGAIVPVRIDPSAYVLSPGDSLGGGGTSTVVMQMGVKRVDAVTGRVAASEVALRAPTGGCQQVPCGYTPPQLDVSNPQVGTLRDEYGALAGSAEVPVGQQWTDINALSFELANAGDTTISISSTPAPYVAPPPDIRYDSRLVISYQTVQADVFSVASAASSTTAAIGDIVTFTVDADAISPVSDVHVYVKLPRGFTLNTATATEGNFDTSSRMWRLGSFSSGQATLTLTARATEYQQLGADSFVAEIAGVASIAEGLSRQNNNLSAIPIYGPTKTFLANEDFIVIRQDEMHEVDVLANDTNALGFPVPAAVQLSVDSAPAHGAAVIQDRRIQYRPVAGFRGVDTLRYRLTNGAEAAVATLTIVVGNQP